MKKLFTSILAFSLFVSTSISAQNALDFDGSDDIVQTGYAGVMGTADRTFEAWVNVSSIAPNSNLAIIDYGKDQVGSRNTFVVGSNRSLRFISGGTNANISSSANDIPTEQWVHVAFVLNNGVGYLYVNGVQTGTGSLSTVNTPSGNQNLMIGQRVTGGTIPFHGKIDEVRIWKKALSATQISQNMNTELCGSNPDLVAYYNFNHGMAGGSNTNVITLTDYSGNSNDGTLSNFSLNGSASNWVTGQTLTIPQGVTDSVNATMCTGSVYTFGTQQLTTAGTYVETFKAPNGCDSTVTLFLDTVSMHNVSASIVNYEFVANPANQTYQWYRCSPWFKMNGETNRIFTPTDNKYYCVVVSNGSCSDTSDCVSLASVGLNELNRHKWNIYPNPANGELHFDLGLNHPNLHVNIYTIEGRLIDSFEIENSSTKKYSLKEKGVFYIHIESNSERKVIKLINL